MCLAHCVGHWNIVRQAGIDMYICIYVDMYSTCRHVCTYWRVTIGIDLCVRMYTTYGHVCTYRWMYRCVTKSHELYVRVDTYGSVDMFSTYRHLCTYGCVTIGVELYVRMATHVRYVWTGMVKMTGCSRWTGRYWFTETCLSRDYAAQQHYRLTTIRSKVCIKWKNWL